MESNKEEKIFEEYLSLKGIRYARIPEFPDIKTPDYLVRVNDSNLLCEVKTLQPNKTDKGIESYLDQAVDDGKTKPIVYERTSNKTIRNDIHDAHEQLKAFDFLQLPGVVVLFCNRISENFTVDRETIWEAMFGTPSYITDAEHRSISYLGRRGGKLRENENTHVTAIAIPILSSLQIQSCAVYYNPFAKYSLANKIFCVSDINVIPTETKISFEDV